MAQTIIPHPLTPKDWVQFEDIPSRICGGQNVAL
jgi:hypothetical protein